VVDLIAERAGIASRVPHEILHRASMITSDFPELLSNAANKILLGSYQVAAPVFQAIAARKPFKDFKPHTFIRVGDFPNLLPVNEAGEFKHGVIKEDAEPTSLTTYGRIIGLTRQAIINDDLSAFADLAVGAGRAAARLEADLFIDLLLLNGGEGPTLSDGLPMFHANHANLAASGSALDATSLGAARSALRKQKNLEGNAMNIAPRFIYVGADNETPAEQVVAQITPRQVGDVNPFSGRQEVLADGRLTGTTWYSFADPERDGSNFVYGYLSDNAGPSVTQHSPFSYDGVALKVVHDFAVGAVDYRFGYRNPGA
jgi:hypothetical protein